MAHMYRRSPPVIWHKCRVLTVWPLTGDEIDVHGVAPQGDLMGYKPCSGLGSSTGTLGCTDTAIMLALEDAMSPRTVNGFPKPVAHVINLSLGGLVGRTHHPRLRQTMPLWPAPLSLLRPATMGRLVKPWVMRWTPPVLLRRNAPY